MIARQRNEKRYRKLDIDVDDNIAMMITAPSLMMENITIDMMMEIYEVSKSCIVKEDVGHIYVVDKKAEKKENKLDKMRTEIGNDLTKMSIWCLVTKIKKYTFSKETITKAPATDILLHRMMVDTPLVLCILFDAV